MITGLPHLVETSALSDRRCHPSLHPGIIGLTYCLYRALGWVGV